VAAIEQSRNVTIDVLEQYINAVGGKLEVTVIKGNRRFPLLAPRTPRTGRRAAKTTKVTRGRSTKSA
jgi:hypothetical protein